MCFEIKIKEFVLATECNSTTSVSCVAKSKLQMVSFSSAYLDSPDEGSR